MDYPIKTGKPSYKEANKIGTDTSIKKKQPKMDKSLFSADALESSIATTAGYASKTKGVVDNSVFCLEANSIFPDNKCC